jgi:hypothetical protein
VFVSGEYSIGPRDVGGGNHERVGEPKRSVPGAPARGSDRDVLVNGMRWPEGSDGQGSPAGKFRIAPSRRPDQHLR